MSQIPSFYLIRNVQKKELSDGGCSGGVYTAIWDWCEDELDELATQIAPDWGLPADAVESGLKTLRSHLEQAEGGAALLYEMT